MKIVVCALSWYYGAENADLKQVMLVYSEHSDICITDMQSNIGKISFFVENLLLPILCEGYY